MVKGRAIRVVFAAGQPIDVTRSGAYNSDCSGFDTLAPAPEISEGFTVNTGTIVVDKVTVR